MRYAIWGALAGIVLTATLTTWPADAQPPAYRNSSPQGGLITYVQTHEMRPTELIVIDPNLRSVGVYHVGREKGEIQLKSVRQFSWDLQMTDYNTSTPLPEEIRKGLERQP